MLKIYHLTDVTLRAPLRGNYSIPDFAVCAETPDEASDKCSKIVLCDRRATDTPDQGPSRWCCYCGAGRGIPWTLAFTATSGEERVSFSIAMDSDPISTQQAVRRDEIRKLVTELGHYASPDKLHECGWPLVSVEMAVRKGWIRWTQSGHLESTP